MAIDDIPTFRPARAGQVVRSEDWNGMQRALRNAVRTHRHTRPPGQAGDDASEQDVAEQVSTPEIADAAVTLAKLDDDLRSRLGSVATGVAELNAGERQEIKHGLGERPVGVLLGPVSESLSGLQGSFEVYGAAGSQVLAAVPTEPSGSFFLISQSEGAVRLRWWALGGPAEG